jgi:hypothetical protein
MSKLTFSLCLIFCLVCISTASAFTAADLTFDESILVDGTPFGEQFTYNPYNAADATPNVIGPFAPKPETAFWDKHFAKGWIVTAVNGASNNIGFLGDPAPGFFTGQPANPLSGRFPPGLGNGTQYAGGNFNNGTTDLRFETVPIALLQPNEVVNLSVDVFTRLQFGFIPVYSVSLQDSLGNIIGTPAVSTLAAPGDGQTVTYSLDTSTVPGLVGKSVSVRIDVSGQDFTQAIFDNVRLEGNLLAIPEPASMVVLLGLATMCSLGSRRMR